MSFILEALRKSEIERQRLNNASIADLPAGRKARRQPWWVWALAALLLINLAVLTIVLLRDPTPPTKQELLPTPAASANVAANTNIQPNPAPPLPIATQSGQTMQPLAQEAAPPQVTYESVPRTEMELANAGASVPEGPTLVRPIEPNANPNNAAPATAPTVAAASPKDIHIDLHVFSQNRRDSFVLINMHRYTEGQRLLEGPFLEQITPEGIVLNLNGRRYQMNRN